MTFASTIVASQVAILLILFLAHVSSIVTDPYLSTGRYPFEVSCTLFPVNIPVEF
jgi:hypothetical protein